MKRAMEKLEDTTAVAKTVKSTITATDTERCFRFIVILLNPVGLRTSTAETIPSKISLLIPQLSIQFFENLTKLMTINATSLEMRDGLLTHKFATDITGAISKMEYFNKLLCI